jgi:hypothetical protein
MAVATGLILYGCLTISWQLPCSTFKPAGAVSPTQLTHPVSMGRVWHRGSGSAVGNSPMARLYVSGLAYDVTLLVVTVATVGQCYADSIAVCIGTVLQISTGER